MATDSTEAVKPRRRRTGCWLGAIAGLISFVVFLTIFLRVSGIYHPVFSIIGMYLNDAGQAVMPPDPTKEEASIHDQNYLTANSLTSSGEYAAAIPYWDLVLAEQPSGDSYFQRAGCYYQLSRDQRSYADFVNNLNHALADIDQSIALDVEAGIWQGYAYEMRAYIYDSLASAYEDRATNDRYLALAAENMRAAVARWTSAPYAYRNVPVYLFYGGQCEAGVREFERIQAFEGKSAPPKSSLLALQAQAYLCQGEFEKALEANRQARAIQETSGYTWMQTVILFDMDRYDEALDLLNEDIENDPYYSGMRYYLRAVIYQAQGQRDQAQQDLDMGSGNTWGQLGLKDYVLGQMAIEDGNTQEAVERLQSAYLTLPWLVEHPLKERIAEQLAELGAQLPTPAPGPQIAATPLPETLFAEDPLSKIPETGVNENGLTTPPFPIPARLETGVEDVQFEITPPMSGAHRLPTYLFSPDSPVKIRQVNRLSFTVESDAGGEVRFLVYLWDQTSGEWTLIRPQWGENVVEEPERYVDHEGRVYLVTRLKDAPPAVADRLWVTMEVTTEDGQKVTLGKGD